MISLGRWQFDFNEPLLIGLSVLLLASFLLSVHLVQKRLLKRAPLRAVAIMLLNFTAYGAVFLLLLEPGLNRQVQQSVTLITEGAETGTAGSTYPDKLYVAPGVPTSPANTQNLVTANWLLDTTQLSLREPALSEINVHGFGLERDQWQKLPKHLKVRFEPPDIHGFTAMRWPRSLTEGEVLLLSGHYQTPGNDAIIQLRLLDPAGNHIDEARIKSGQSFHLAARVKTSGNLAYKLQAWNNDLMLSEQIVPLEVAAGNPVNILIRQSAPSFETRALMKYAESQGHRIRLITDISKGKTISQSANLPAGTDNSLSPQNLAEHDLLTMDGRALVNLPATQRQWLNEAVEQGLGLLLLADSTLMENIRDLSLLNGFHLAPLTDTETTLVPRLLTADAKNWQEPVTVAAMQLSAEDADVLIDDGQNRSLVVNRQKGLGHIGISLISHSHSWLTSGHNALWGDYWRTLFSNLARQRQQGYLLSQAQTEFHRVNQRVAVCALNTEDDSKVFVSALATPGHASVFKLTLAADRLNSPRQCVYFWPEVNGWYQLQLYSSNLDSVVDQKTIYVFAADQWLAQHRSERLQATMARAINSKTLLLEPEARWVSEPLSPFWLWLTLVFSASCLWLERKLDFAWKI